MTNDINTDMSNIIECANEAIDISTIEVQNKNNLSNEITPWVNGNLQKLFKIKKQLLRLRRKKPGDDVIAEKLKRISRVTKKVLKYSMKHFYEDKLDDIHENPKKCWKFLNETLGRSTKPSINIKDTNDELVLEDFQKAELLNKFFTETVEQLKMQIEESPGDTCNSLRTLILHNHRFHANNTTEEEIVNIITNLKLNKSPGNDCIFAKMLINCVNDFAPHLVNIFNNMLNKSIYPDVLKIHKVVPIPKEINVNSLDMYRPVAILSVVNNVFEKILYSQIFNYLESENLLNEHQYGFRKGCGTEEAVVNVVNFICGGLDRGCNGVAGVFFDFTKAFDLIDHEILLMKLKYYGIWGKELSLIQSYLSNRKQFVEINSFKSTCRPIKYGIPQGSVLGPLLFSIYLNDIKNLNFKGKLFVYADDVCLFYPYKHEIVAKVNMEYDASLLFEYARINKLVLNANKTKVIRFRPQINPVNEFSIYVNGEEIVEEHSIKYLGVYLQSNLTWKEHIHHLKTKIAQAVGLLYKFKNKFHRETKLLLYNALIQSHLNYLAILYGYKNSVELKSLQRIKNKALKIVANLPQRYHFRYNDFKFIFPIPSLNNFQLFFACIQVH